MVRGVLGVLGVSSYNSTNSFKGVTVICRPDISFKALIMGLVARLVLIIWVV